MIPTDNTPTLRMLKRSSPTTRRRHRARKVKTPPQKNGQFGSSSRALRHLSVLVSVLLVHPLLNYHTPRNADVDNDICEYASRICFAMIFMYLPHMPNETISLSRVPLMSRVLLVSVCIHVSFQ
jgi:hypothetical protein